MWAPPPEAGSRVALLARWFEENIPKLWHTNDEDHLEQYGRYRYAFEFHSEPRTDNQRSRIDQYCKATAAALEATFPREFLSLALAEFLAYPFGTGSLPSNRQFNLTHHLATHFAARSCIESRSVYALSLVGGRLEHILRNPFVHAERPVSYSSSQGELFEWPTAGDCTLFIDALRELPEALPLIRAVVLGEWFVPGPLPVPDGAEVFDREQSNYQRFGAHLLPRQSGFLETLWRAGELDFEAYAWAMRLNPLAINPPFMTDGEVETETDEFRKTEREYVRRLLWVAAQDVSNAENLRLIESYWHWEHTGAHYLMKVCEQIDRLSIGTLRMDSYEKQQHALRFLAGIDGLDREDDVDTVIRELQAFDTRTLKIVLPAAKAAQDIVLRALGWDAALPLLEILRTNASRASASDLWSRSDFPTCSDPNSGVLDRTAILSAIERASDAIASEMIDIFRKSRAPCQNTLVLIEACRGWNAGYVEKRLSKHVQICLKAYGLLPLARGEEEVLERYLALRKAAKEASRYGAEREANTRAAVAAGLTNLAHNAGRSDSTRLEWSMEAKLAQSAEQDGAQEIDGHTLRIAFTQAEPKIVISRGARELKSVPAAVRKSDVYGKLKTTLAELRSQATRCRRTLEDLMARGESLAPDDLAEMSRLPLLRRYLSALVLASEESLGLYDVDGQHLVGIEGSLAPLPQQVVVAHPIDLLETGTMSSWQREVVRLGIVQPFKQVFREIYVLTPAEQDALESSTRFAGHVLNARVASRLFQARGWEMESGDIAVPYKVFREEGLTAVFEFPDAGHFLSELDEVTSDEIYFVPHEPGEFFAAEKRVPLSDVPLKLFSETMRDADLVVSVAQSNPEAETAHFSRESYARRQDLVSVLVARMNLPGVTLDGHFARIQGKRAQYRVHLASGSIHIEPGNYLCVVPDWRKGGGRILLPFAEHEDVKAAEVVSKIVLLANDDTIKDEAILRQIRRSD